MMLQATMDVRFNSPSLAVRLHRNCPEEFLLKVCELARLGTGFPAIHNDEVGIKALLRKGVTTEEARDWCLVGCVEPNLPGKLHQWSDYGHYNFGSAVEFALFNGEHLLSGRTLGLETGDAERLRDVRGVRGGGDGAARQRAPPHRHPGARDRGAAPRAAAVRAGLVA